MATHIQRSALLPYSAQQLYSLVNDVERYPEFLPWCAAATVLEVSETTMRASLQLSKAGISQRLLTRNTLTANQSIEMQLEEGLFKQFYGLWTFTALQESACKVSLDLRFEYAGSLLGMALAPMFNKASATLLDAFCARAQALYG